MLPAAGFTGEHSAAELRHEPVWWPWCVASRASDSASEEDHNKRVRRDDDVVGLVIAAEDLVARVRELHADDGRESGADHAASYSEEQVDVADVFVIAGSDEANDAGPCSSAEHGVGQNDAAQQRVEGAQEEGLPY